MFSPCTDIGSLGIKFNVSYSFEHCKVAYNGNLTFPYDEDDEELLTSIRFDKWGSTGGWKYEGTFERYDIMTYLLTYFPNAFKSFYGSMGITGKPMPAESRRKAKKACASSAEVQGNRTKSPDWISRKINI
ncbi:uncharacterized protein LOC124775213 isoform X2 [Schistocerca piceifrons]|uniref:uncharacterized protein LOC124775213 isoform X2 n=1 Tax=Schistocerca piceifrons TaxID=274613 RepID=UPI001F5FD8C2|nr:uncharacterized protein LOC124775213 isoform X2 [Schistocerca piceifrons]